MNKSGRTACIYHFFSANREHSLNLQFFLQNGILEHTDYIILLASNPDFPLPNRANIAYYQIENKLFDIGGYLYGLEKLQRDSSYDYVFFLNSGALGPLYAENESDWTKKLIPIFSDSVKLIGITINFLPRPIPWSRELNQLIDESVFSSYFSETLLTHVQTYFFGIDREGLNFLREKQFFNQKFKNDKLSLIANFEITLSQLILNSNKNWTISSHLERYRNYNFKELQADPNLSSAAGDPLFKESFFGQNINPRESLFFKTTRKIIDSHELAKLRLQT